MIRLGLAVLAAIIAFTGVSAAQDFPQRPITLIVPFPAGGPADGLARAFAEGLGQELGQSIVVDNRPGGGTMVGLSAAARSEPDGYTLVLGVSATTIQPTINPSLGFDPTTDLTAITLMVEPHMAFLVNTASGMKTIGDLIERARADPGTVTYASTGHGAATHIAGAYFASMAGLDMVHVPYQGSAPAVVDLLGGRVDMLVDAISGALGYMDSGELHALATTSSERSTITPDVPAANETLENFDARSFIGLFGPGGLPQDIRDRLHEASVAALNNPSVAERARSLSMDVVGLGPDEFGALIVRDTEKWRNIMIESGIIEAE